MNVSFDLGIKVGLVEGSLRRASCVMGHILCTSGGKGGQREVSCCTGVDSNGSHVPTPRHGA